MAGQRPPFTVCVVNKDGSHLTFKGFDGQERTSKFCPIGALYPNNFGGFNFRVERKVTLDPAKHYVNVYNNKERGGQSSEKKTDDGQDSDDGLFE